MFALTRPASAAKTRAGVFVLQLLLFSFSPFASNALTEGDYTYTVSGEKATITRFNTSYSGALAITNSLGGFSVTCIGDNAFAYCTGLTSVTIPGSVTNVGDGAFSGCDGLTQAFFVGDAPSAGLSSFVYYPTTVYRTAAAAGWPSAGEFWADCPTELWDGVAPPALSGDFTWSGGGDGEVFIDKYTGTGGAVVIPTTIYGQFVTGIGKGAFYNCTGLTSITIPSSVTSIGDEAFFSCYGLTSVTIPAGVTSIANSAFSDCYGLTSVTIPAGVTSIGNHAFGHCYGLTSVTIPEGVTTIGDWAFVDCRYLTSVTIPSSVTSIGDYAFYLNWSLTVVTIPAGVTSIGNNAFGECYDLTSVTIPESVTNIGDSAFYYCNHLFSVAIPSSVTRIGDFAFMLCDALTSVTFSVGLADIGIYAFDGCCGLTSVTIPSSVTNIGDGAFAYCPKLTSALFKGKPPTSVGPNAFFCPPTTLYHLPGFASDWTATFCGYPTLCWNPQVQHDAEFGFASDHFGFNIAGTTNIPVVVETTTNLASGTWTSLTNTTLGASGSLHFEDSESSGTPSRFYRIVFP